MCYGAAIVGVTWRNISHYASLVLYHRDQLYTRLFALVLPAGVVFQHYRPNATFPSSDTGSKTTAIVWVHHLSTSLSQLTELGSGQRDGSVCFALIPHSTFNREIKQRHNHAVPQYRRALPVTKYNRMSKSRNGPEELTCLLDDPIAHHICLRM